MLVIFVQNICAKYFCKKVSQLLLCSAVMQNIQIFCGGPVMIVGTCFFPIYSTLFLFLANKEELNQITKGLLKTLSNIKDGAFYKNS